MFGVSRWMPCPECGASVPRDATHRCEPARRADYQVFRLRREGAIDRLEDDYRAWLDTPKGLFEVWLAQRQVRGQR